MSAIKVIIARIGSNELLFDEKPAGEEEG